MERHIGLQIEFDSLSFHAGGDTPSKGFSAELPGGTSMCVPGEQALHFAPNAFDFGEPCVSANSTLPPEGKALLAEELLQVSGNAMMSKETKSEWRVSESVGLSSHYTECGESPSASRRESTLRPPFSSRGRADGYPAQIDVLQGLSFGFQPSQSRNRIEKSPSPSAPLCCESASPMALHGAVAASCSQPNLGMELREGSGSEMWAHAACIDSDTEEETRPAIGTIQWNQNATPYSINENHHFQFMNPVVADNSQAPMSAVSYSTYSQSDMLAMEQQMLTKPPVFTVKGEYEPEPIKTASEFTPQSDVSGKAPAAALSAKEIELLEAMITNPEKKAAMLQHVQAVALERLNRGTTGGAEASRVTSGPHAPSPPPYGLPMPSYTTSDTSSLKSPTWTEVSNAVKPVGASMAASTVSCPSDAGRLSTGFISPMSEIDVEGSQAWASLMPAKLRTTPEMSAGNHRHVRSKVTPGVLIAVGGRRVPVNQLHHLVPSSGESEEAPPEERPASGSATVPSSRRLPGKVVQVVRPSGSTREAVSVTKVPAAWVGKDVDGPIVVLEFPRGLVMHFAPRRARMGRDGAVNHSSLQVEVGLLYLAYVRGVHSSFGSFGYTDVGRCVQVYASSAEFFESEKQHGVPEPVIHGTLVKCVDTEEELDFIEELQATESTVFEETLKRIEKLKVPLILDSVHISNDEKVCVLYVSQVRPESGVNCQMSTKMLQKDVQRFVKYTVCVKLV